MPRLGALEQVVDAVVGNESPVVDECGLVAFVHLVHHMRADDQGLAFCAPLGKLLPYTAAENRVDAYGRLV